MRKWIKWVITAAIILMIMTPSLGAISKDEATQLSDYKLISLNSMRQEKEYMITQQIYLIRVDESNTEARGNLDMRLMEERLKSSSIPGFGIIAAISVVLAVCYLIKRKE